MKPPTTRTQAESGTQLKTAPASEKAVEQTARGRATGRHSLHSEETSLSPRLVAGRWMGGSAAGHTPVGETSTNRIRGATTLYAKHSDHFKALL